MSGQIIYFSTVGHKAYIERYIPSLACLFSVSVSNTHPLEKRLCPSRVEIDFAAILVEQSWIVLHQNLERKKTNKTFAANFKAQALPVILSVRHSVHCHFVSLPFC